MSLFPIQLENCLRATQLVESSFSASLLFIEDINKQVSQANPLFFAETFLVICPISILKLAMTVFTCLCFQTLRPNHINLIFSLINKKLLCR